MKNIARNSTRSKQLRVYSILALAKRVQLHRDRIRTITLQFHTALCYAYHVKLGLSVVMHKSIPSYFACCD